MASDLPKTTSLSKPILFLTFCIVFLLSLPNPLRPLLHTKPPRNGPLPPPQPQLQQTSTKVFSPRTQRELSYLSKPFIQDFLSLSAASNVFIVDLPHARYAYCSVAQAGRTYSEDLLRRLYPDKNVTARTDAMNMDEEYVTSIIRDDNFPKYVMVRNPMRRTLSAFLHIVGPNVPEKKHVEAFHNWVSRQFPDTRSFTAEELNRKDQHWIPQHIHCGMHKARVFKVFKYEYPELLVDFLKSMLPADVLPEWRMRDTSPVVDDAEFVRFYNNTDVFDRVQKFCKRDIEMFDYHEEIYAMRQTVLNNIGR